MQWSDEYLIGVSTIDSQHKRLFEFFDELEAAVEEDEVGTAVGDILTKLDLYKTRHFQLEEKYMQECRYPGLDEQIEAHASFTRLFGGLRQKLAEQGYSAELAATIKAELMQWIQNHVIVNDKAFGDFYKGKSRGAEEK